MSPSPQQCRPTSKFKLSLPIKPSSKKKLRKGNKSHIYNEELSTDCSDISSYKGSTGSKSDDDIHGGKRGENEQNYQPVSIISHPKLCSSNMMKPDNGNRPISCDDINVLSGNGWLGKERDVCTRKKTQLSSSKERSDTMTQAIQQKQRNENEVISYPQSPDLRGVGNRQKEKKASGHLKNMHHFSWMFMLITGICVACYIPKIALILVEAANKTFWVDIPDNKLGVALFFYRLYIFNNVCNPIIYCFFDPRFRRELKILCKCRGK
ncbi:hypothetical protein FSP39_019589 [Pinctada imbricata]|uniref:G-protein coupled receptors family 1 profile domain-containing protein n=1 Tax=Pinctada imbricata TaxID=66713 RepID=A0AA89BV41_PINIB|nr:hypothetical protein FSP39_019589 [Pinctada imbricata]